MSLQDKAVLVDFSVGMWTGSKQDHAAGLEVTQQKGAESDAAAVIKRLVPKDWLEPLVKIRSAANTTHYKMTSPWFRDGQSLLANTMMLDYLRAMQKYELEWQDVLEHRVLCDYGRIVRQAPVRLGGLYNSHDFPSEEQMRGKFYYKVLLLPVPSNDDWRVNIGKDEQELLERTIAQQAEELTQDLWKRTYKVVKEMVEKLTRYEEGEQKRFNDTLVGNVLEVVELLPRMNVVGDAELDRMAGEIKRKLTTFSAQDLRDDADVRQAVLSKAQAIMDNMVGYMGSGQ